MTRTMKKVLSWLLVAVMLICMLPTTVFAGEKLTVSAGTVTDVNNTEGTEVSVPLNLANNTGLEAIIVKVQFDKDALKMTKVVDNELLKYYDEDKEKNVPFTYTGFSQANNGEQVNATGEVTLVWYATNSSDENGKLATLKFAVKAGASAGQKDIVVAINSLTVGGETASSDTYTTANGSVTLVNPTVPVTGVTLDKSALSLDLKKNQTATLTATVSPDNATDKTVTWNSSAPSVATVENGVVTAVGVGDATITVTTGNGKTATCTVKVVNCLHTQKQLVNAKDSTCTEKGWNAYYTCDCGVKLGSDGTTVIAAVPEKELAAHDFSKEDVMAAGALKTSGDCTKKAVYYKSCTVCGALSHDDAYTFESEFGAHTLTKTEAKDATCTVDGNYEYWTCSTCHKVFKADKATETTVEAETIAAQHKLIHKLGRVPTCTLPGEKEHYTCSACGKNFSDATGTTELTDITLEAEGHTYGDLIAKTPATCVEKGMEAHYQCKVCHAYFDRDKKSVVKSELEIVIDSANHAVVLTTIDAKAATCTEAGNNEYYKCSACNELFSDAEGKTGIDSVPTIPALGHKMTKTEAVAPTCTEAGNKEYYKCSACNNLFSDAEGNTATTAEDVTIAAKGHKMTKTEAKAATCTEDGYEAYWTCSVCKRMFSDAKGENVIEALTVVNKLGHDMTHHELVEATCQKTGMSEYYECSRCKGLFRENTVDAASVTAESLVISKIAHTYSDSYAYTTTEHWKFCTVCGEKLDKAAHVFTEDETTGTKTCTTCGYKKFATEPDHTCTTPNGWSFDDNSHWHACDRCSKKSDEAAHDIDWVIDVEATTTSDGLRHGKCKCGYVKQEVIAKITTTPTTPSHRPGSSTGSATSSDKVQSSKTFDAGIATYVGLSILSLTGSALVIGKKKEF